MYMFIYKVTHVFQSYLVTFWQLYCHLLFSTWVWLENPINNHKKQAIKNEMGPSIFDTCRSKLIYIVEK